MSHRVHHNAERTRYELFVDDELAGIADYRLSDDGVVMFPHTEIARERRGQGLGAELVGRALDDVRDAGRTVEARCWFVAQFIDEHPEYRDLVVT